MLWFALFPTLSYASETVTNQTYTYDWREAERELQEYMQDSSVSGSTTWTVDKDDVANGLVQAYFLFQTRSDYEYKYIGNPFSWVSPAIIDVQEFSAALSSYDSLSSGVYKRGLVFSPIITTVDGSVLIHSGDSANLVMNGFKHQMRHTYTWSWSTVNVGGGSGSGVEYYPIDPNEIDYIAIVYFRDNGQRQVELLDISDVLTIKGDTFGIDCDITAPFDVVQINIEFGIPLSAYNWSVPDVSGYHKDAYYAGGTGIYFQTNIYNGVLKIDIPDETSGLLSGIIEWLRSIRDGIVNVANYVLELPSRIWTFIQEGLKMLFIPSESDITDMHNQWDELMRDRFGAIYEAGDLVHSFGATVQTSAIMAVDSGGVIELPSATVNLAGVPFTFGGYTVDIIPAGFEFLSTAVKSIVNIVCTVIFLNMLRNKLEELIR